MTRRHTETLIKAVELFGTFGEYTKVARALHLGHTTIGRWVAASADAEDREDTSSKFYFAMPGTDEPDYFHNHLKFSLECTIDQIEATVLKTARDGIMVGSVYKGQRVYELNPDLVGMDEDTMNLLGYTDRDRYARDEDGRLKQVMIWQPPSVERQLAALNAFAPERWSKKSQIDVNANISGGVQVSHWLPGQAKQLPQQQPKPLPQIEVIPDEVVENIIDAEAEEITAPMEPEVVEDDVEPAPAPVVRAPPEARRVGNALASDLAAFMKLSPEERAAAALARQSKGK